MRKWISNSREVLSEIPEEYRSKTFKELDLDTDELPAERVLGLQWCIETDTLSNLTSEINHNQDVECCP